MSENAPFPTAGKVHRELADAVVRILRETTGRGATRARSIISEDVVVVILQDTLTKGEQLLVERGQEDEVLAYRHAFQKAMTLELTTAVEQIMGREVVAFMSTNHVEPDCSCEIFVLGDARV